MVKIARRISKEMNLMFLRTVIGTVVMMKCRATIATVMTGGYYDVTP